MRRTIQSTPRRAECGQLASCLFSVFVFCEAQAGKLPARRWIEEITVSWTGVTGGSRKRRAAQDQLIYHELAIVLAERARRSFISGIWRIRTARPLPDNSVSVGKCAAFCRNLPLALGRKILVRPAREGIRFVIADMTNGRGGIDR